MEVDALRTYYRTRQRERIHAVDGVSFHLRAGEVLGIAGESGCGKSTLAVSLMGLYSPPLHYLSGGIRIEGEEITGLPREELRARVLGKRIAYIPQAAMNVLNPTRRIFPFIRDILEENGLFTGDGSARELAARRFSDLHLPARALDAYPNELSGGMKQRVVIAVSTILDPSILVADEPTSALDVTTQKVVIRMLRDLMRRGIVKSMVFITHELPILRHIADRILVMYAGRIVESGPMSRLIFDPLHPYARALMSSIIVPERGMKTRALACLEGEPPSLKGCLQGCAFAERCALATDACRAVETPAMEVEDGMYRCVFDRTTLREMYQRGAK